MRANPFIRLILPFALATLAASTGLAQTRPIPGTLPLPGEFIPALFPANLKQYLGLSEDQVTQVTTLNQHFDQFLAAKTQRQIQLRIEILQETNRPSLDAMAIGTRYAEMEQIRRDIEAERARTVASIQNTLTEAQKGKLAVLQQALLDYPTACTAISQNVMTVPIRSVFDPLLNNDVIGSTYLSGSFLLAPSCPAPTAAYRVGLYGLPSQ